MAAPGLLDRVQPPRPGPPGLPTLPTLPPFTPQGPFGVAPNVGRYTRPNWSWIDRFSQRSPEELSAVQNVSSLARLISGQGTGLFNVGSPAYSQALNYYRRLLGGSREAITEAVAPQAQAITDIYKGAKGSLEASSLRGGARETALGEMARERVGAVAGLPAQAREGAAAAAGQLGLVGAQAGTQAEAAGAGLFQNLLGAEQANRFGGISAAQQQQQIGLQATMEVARLTLDDLVQSGRLGLEEYRILTGNNLALGQLTLDQYLGQANLDLRRRELANGEKQRQQEKSAAKWRLIGQIIGTVGGAIIGGPPGAAAGGALGGAIGGAVGGGGSGGGGTGPIDWSNFGRGGSDYTPEFDWPSDVPAGTSPGRT